MARPYNFYAGPAAIPLPALQAVQSELLDYNGSGLSIMEVSHRGKDYDHVHEETIALVKELMGLDDRFHVLLLHGGASTQFAMVPMNFLPADGSADYILTGEWSKKALKEAKGLGKPRVAATTELEGGVFRAIPKQDQLDLDANAAYCHFTTNNTIFGTQFNTMPQTGDVPLVADMSSDILSRQIDPSPFGLIYAGAQKNLGPSGLALVVIRDDMVGKCKAGVPTMFSYKTHVDKNSLFNTPPCLAIYVMNKVLHWLKGEGGVDAIEKVNAEKAAIIYGAIDGSGGYYRNTIAPEDRSKMNIVFNLPSEELEKKFVKEGEAAGFIGIKGHRSVGGIRISAYNAAPLQAAKDVAVFMKEFCAKNG